MSILQELARKDAAGRRKTPTIFKGVDLVQEAWRYCQHLGYKRNVELMVKHSATPVTHGKQWHMVTQLTIGLDESLADVLQMLLHEISHIKHMDHTEAFIEHMVNNAREIWGINVEGWQEVKVRSSGIRAYAVDDFLTARLAARLKAGAYRPVVAKLGHIVPTGFCHVCDKPTRKGHFFMCSQHWYQVPRFISCRLSMSQKKHKTMWDQDGAYYRQMQEAIAFLKDGKD